MGYGKRSFQVFMKNERHNMYVLDGQETLTETCLISYHPFGKALIMI